MKVMTLGREERVDGGRECPLNETSVQYTRPRIYQQYQQYRRTTRPVQLRMNDQRASDNWKTSHSVADGHQQRYASD